MQNGLTPLNRAVKSKNVEVVKHLLESGADVHNRDSVRCYLNLLSKIIRN